MRAFQVSAYEMWSASGWKTGHKIIGYHGAGTASVVEGMPEQGVWTKAEAEAAAARANAGNEVGIKFGVYADD